MIRRTILGTGFVVSTCVLLATPAVWAQQASGIAGVVRDSTGALLPGVTVEAASPALIEKVRTAVSDGQGRYSLVELVSGTYSVTFALTGFKTVRREGILLTSGFTASVDVELQVGSLEETLTVTGDSPLVDTQNVRAQIAVSDEVLKALPTGTESVAAVFVRLVPGFVGHTLARSDVGGSAGVFWSDLVTGSKFHGKVDPTYKSNLDGMRINGFGSGGGTGGSAYITNTTIIDEVVLETSGVSAESTSSGVETNVIPKSGGNTFTFQASGLYTGGSLQSNNLRAGFPAQPSQLDNLYFATVSAGGPIMRDKLWFYTAPRWDHNKNMTSDLFVNLTHGTAFYTPDRTQPSFSEETWRSNPVRLTWQVSSTDKVNVYADYEPYCGCPRAGGTGSSLTDAAYNRFGWIKLWPGGRVRERAFG
jgi:carboxypeptidase family protein